MMLSGIIRLLRSLKLTVVLIICLTVVILLGVVIPQKDLLGKDLYLKWKAEKPELVSAFEFLGLTDIYVSPFTLALWCVFFLNLIVVMSARMPAIWKRCINRSLPAGIDALKGSSHYEIVETRGMEDVKSVLSGRGYKVFSEGGAFRAVKNRFSPLATLLFHLSFFLLLVGGVISFYTKFTAETTLAVGETFMGDYDQMSRPKVGPVPRTVFRVDSVQPYYYEGDLPVDLKVVLTTKKGRKEIGINRPYKEGPLSFVIKDMDVAPLFTIRDKTGKVLDGAYVKLKVLDGAEDRFEMLGYEFRTFFYTDYDKGFKTRKNYSSELPQALKQSPSSAGRRQQREIVNPAFYVAVFKDGDLLGIKTIALNEYMEFDGMRLFFEDLTYWINFLVIKEYGLSILYAGFVLITVALIIRFVFYRRDLMGVLKDGKLHIAGRAEYFPSLFENEFGRVTRALRGT